MPVTAKSASPARNDFGGGVPGPGDPECCPHACMVAFTEGYEPGRRRPADPPVHRCRALPISAANAVGEPSKPRTAS